MVTIQSGLVVGGLVLAAALGLPAQAQHDHAAHAHATAPVPAPATRWETDAALRDGMGRIRAALDELRHHEMGHMGEAIAKDRAGEVERAVADIFAKCKLTPERDAVLHGMLMPLLVAAGRLKADSQEVAEVAAMRRAVAGYPRYFDDPSWTADDHATTHD